MQSNKLTQIQTELNSIIENSRKNDHIKKIILFGSYGYGTPGAESDIDLCFITDEQKRKLDIIRDLQKQIYKLVNHTIDILVYSPEEFADRADSITTIEKTILTKGVVIYEKV